MKKFLSIALAALMLAALTLPMYAAEAVPVTGNTGSVNVQVTPVDDPGTPGDESTVYSVGFDWDEMIFTYSGTWNPTNLAYEAIPG